MTTTSLYTLAPYLLLPNLKPGSEAVQQALRLAGHDFCRRSGAWRATLTASPAAEAFSVALALPDGFTGNVGKLSSVRIDDGTGEEKVLPLEDVTLTPDLALSWTLWNPDGTETLDADVTLWPDLATYSYPAEIVTRWSQALIAKALATLLTMTGEPWARPQDAPAQLGIYEEQIFKALGQGNNLSPRRFFFGKPRAFAGPAPAGSLTQRSRYLPRSS